MSSIVQHEPAWALGGAYLRVFGYNPDVDASTGGDEDIIATGGTAYLPAVATAAASINIASTSGDDTNGGAGANTVVLEGLDANYMMQRETVTMAGVSNANPVNDYIRIYRVYVDDVGATGTNAGTITVSDGSGTFATVIAGFGQSTKAVYTIPADYSYGGYLVSYDAEVASKVSAVAEIKLDVRLFGKAWQTKEVFATSNTAPITHVYGVPIRYPPKSDIRLRVFDASADNLPVNGGFELYLR